MKIALSGSEPRPQGSGPWDFFADSFGRGYSCRLLALLVGLVLPATAQVSFERIRNAEKEPANWLTYSGNYSGYRYSPLKQITALNVAKLRPQWLYQLDVTHGFQTSPIVVDGIMYITEPPSNVTALDARTGRHLWKYRRPAPDDLRLCCGRVNRGVAVLDDLVFLATIEAALVALDAKTGRVVWETQVADHKTGYSMTLAPLVVKDKVIVGVAGGEFGIRGYIDAYEAKTGKRAWRFYTVPAAGEPGVETWAGESWKTGAASIWVTGSYDPDQNITIWGVGNPGPDWNGDARAGDNLYSDCFVALDADTGKLKWHFQFTPHDVHDWDATQIPVLIDGVLRGQKRKLVVTANRNGFYYVLDRQSGEYLHSKPFIKQTWATGIDDKGRPMRVPGTAPSVEGTVVYPSVPGGTNWFSPSYNPLTNLFYVAIREEGGVYFKGQADFKPGSFFNGGGFRRVPLEEPWGAIRALQPLSGELAWEFKTKRPGRAGVLSTAGGIVFSGTSDGDALALEARSGKLLWRFQTGGEVASNPVSYLVDGKQQVALAAGRSLFVFGLD
jgi:alcohol dehydrogenase (cytochrome c)